MLSFACFVVLTAVVSAHILPNFGIAQQASNFAPPMHQNAMYPMNPMHNVVHALCGTSDYVCTGPQIIASNSPATFSGSYKYVYVRGMGSSPKVYIQRPDGFWVGTAGDGGCGAFGSFGGSGESKVGLYNSAGTVLTWACK